MACILLFFLLGIIAIGASVCKSPVYPSPNLHPVPFAKNNGNGDNVFGRAFGHSKKGENRLAAGRYNPEIPESCRHSTFCEDVPNYPQEQVDELISRMPRNYSRKTTRATSYTQEDLAIAIQKIKDKELTYAAASRQYGIPTSTLSDRALRKTGITSNTLGRATAIPKEHEDNLANCLRVLEKWGWGLSRQDVLDITQEFINKSELNTPFKNGRPGPDWFIAFCKRHNLSIKKPQPVEYLRKKMTDPFIINEYFKLLEETLRDLNLTDDPKRIWNLDETSLCLDPTRTKVVGAKGAPCTRTTYGSAKENVTVLTTVNAAGGKLDPLIVYKGKYMYRQWMVENTDYDFQLAYASSKRGWMDKEIFYNYMLNVIIPNLGDKRPVLIIYDVHVSHVDDKVVALAVENEVTILKLPPHTSHLLQPLDLAVFKSFKTTWDKNLVKWQRQNVGVKLRKQYFAQMLAEAWQQTKAEVIKNGFKKSGIYPFNASVIPKEKFDPRAYMRWQNHISQQTLKQPKALQQLCLDAMKKSLINNDSSEFVQNINVAFSLTQNLSALNHKQQAHASFEELLLKQVAQQPQNTNNKIAMKLKRVAKGGEVITKAFLEKQQEIEQNKENEKEAQKKIQQIKRKPLESKKQGADPAKPGPSGIQKQKNSLNKTTSPAQILTDQTNSIQYTTAKGKGIGKNTRNDKQNLSSITVDDGENNNVSHSEIDLTDLNVQKMKKLDRSTRKCKSHKDNNIIKPPQNTATKKRVTKRKRIFSTDTTDESTQMSVHSDSDLLDALSDLELFDCDELKEMDPISFEPEIERIVKGIQVIEDQIETPEKCEKIEERKKEGEQIHQMENQTMTPQKYINIERNRQDYEKNNNKVTILSSIRFSPDNQAFYKISGPLQLQPIEKNIDLFTNIPKKKLKKNEVSKIIPKVKKTKTERNSFLCKESEYTTELNTYKIGDTVLVRYFKKTWRYYAGIIENINDSNQKRYTISFYKTIKQNSEVWFVIPKIKDRDSVPDINIVKEIRLLQIQENPAKYTIMDDDDELGNSANFQLERLYRPDIDQRLSLEDDMPLCSSKEKVVHPKVAQGRDGRWYNLVNRQNNPVQGYRVQECDFSSGTKCSDIVVFPPHYNSTCVQKYIYRKVTAFDQSNNNLRAFEQEVKIPSCCSCVATVLFEY